MYCCVYGFFFYEVLWKTTNIQSQKTHAINLDGRLKTIKEPNMLYIRISHWKHKYLIYIYIYMNIYSSFFSRRYRYTSYRQFVRWIWGYLGEKVRVVLLSGENFHLKTNFIQVLILQIKCYFSFKEWSSWKKLLFI